MAKKDGGFSEAEREAMKERAAELRAEKGGKKKADNLQALLDKVAELAVRKKMVELITKATG